MLQNEVVLGSFFLNPLITIDINGERAKLYEDFYFYSARFRGMFIAPAGFETNFASIPQILHSIVKKRGLWDWPAVIHDAGYQGKLVTEHGDRVHLIREFCDLTFYDGLRARLVHEDVAKTMYLMVKMFGSNHYKGLN